MDFLTQLKSLQTYASDPVSLKDKKVLITGATSGIGLATAYFLGRLGAELFLVARREERLQQLQKLLMLPPFSASVHYAAVDLNIDDSFRILKEHGFFEVDMVINNAGLAKGLATIDAARLSDWQAMLQTNVMAAFRIVHEVLPWMKSHKQGHIINIASIAGIETYENASVYCASKHALRAFSRVLRAETCGHGIRVTVLSPGMVDTEFSEVRFDGDVQRANHLYQGFSPLTAIDMAQQIIFSLQQPAHVNIDEIFVTPAVQGSATKVVRQPL